MSKREIESAINGLVKEELDDYEFSMEEPEPEPVEPREPTEPDEDIRYDEEDFVAHAYLPKRVEDEESQLWGITTGGVFVIDEYQGTYNDTEQSILTAEAGEEALMIMMNDIRSDLRQAEQFLIAVRRVVQQRRDAQ